MSHMTVATAPTHSPHEQSIVARPSARALAQISLIQQQLQQLLGDVLTVTPPQALHLTLMEIICNVEYAQPRPELFAAWHAQHNRTVKEILAAFSPITVTFDQLVVSPAAIIIKAADAAPFNAIRTRLLEHTTLPQGTKLPPNIAHCTLARFSKAIDLDMARQQTAGIAVHIVEHFREFRLMTDLGPPFAPRTTEVYKLQQ